MLLNSPKDKDRFLNKILILIQAEADRNLGEYLIKSYSSNPSEGFRLPTEISLPNDLTSLMSQEEYRTLRELPQPNFDAMMLQIYRLRILIEIYNRVNSSVLPVNLKIIFLKIKMNFDETYKPANSNDHLFSEAIMGAYGFSTKPLFAPRSPLVNFLYEYEYYGIQLESSDVDALSLIDLIREINPLIEYPSFVRMSLICQLATQEKINMDQNGETALEAAVDRDLKEIVKFLLQKGAAYNANLLNTVINFALFHDKPFYWQLFAKYNALFQNATNQIGFNAGYMTPEKNTRQQATPLLYVATMLAYPNVLISRHAATLFNKFLTMQIDWEFQDKSVGSMNLPGVVNLDDFIRYMHEQLASLEPISLERTTFNNFGTIFKNASKVEISSEPDNEHLSVEDKRWEASVEEEHSDYRMERFELS